MVYLARRSELMPKIGFGGRSSRVWLARRTRASRGSSRWGSQNQSISEERGSGRSLALCRAQSIVPSSRAASSSLVKKSAGLWRRSVERSRSPAVDKGWISNRWGSISSSI